MVYISLCSPLPAHAVEYLPGIQWNEPELVTPGATNRDPPSDAIILFDGSDKHAWNHAETWTVKDGVLIVGKGMIETKTNVRGLPTSRGMVKSTTGQRRRTGTR